jgi:membrane protease subunit HflK
MTNKPKNPWGNTPQNNNRPTGGGKPPSDMPDIDELLRKAKDNFNFGQGNNGDTKKVVVIGILLLAALWLASGLYRVEPSENAVIQRFGDFSRTQTDAGMGYHIPWPVESVTKINVTEDRRVTIGFGDSLSGRMTGRDNDISEESLMLTSDANIVDIDVVILWNISDAGDYLFNIKDQEETVKRVSESTIREVIGQTKLQPIITTGREDVSQRAKELTQTILDSYGAGISIKQILIQDATVHPNVMEAFDDVVAAGQDAERFQNEANIYQNDILPQARGQAIQMIQKAEGYKETRVARATGEAERFNKLYEAYKTGRDVTRERIFIETMEDVFKNNEKIIIDQQAGSQGVLPYLPLNKK